MLTQHEFVEYGKQAADSYVRADVPLMDSMVKIAAKLDLNRHEINRLVEEANTNTYLKLFETADQDNKYIEFEVADAEKVAEAVAPKISFAKLASFSEDYNSPPPETDANEAPIFGEVEQEGEMLEKLSSAIDYQSIEAKISRRNQMVEITHTFDQRSDQFIDFVKKAALSRVNVESLKLAVKRHVDSPVVDELFKRASEHLNEDDQIDKVASLSETTGIVMLASELVSLADKYVNLRKEDV
jgi:hypothetical protein